MKDLEQDIRLLIKNGIYCQREIFNRLYPSYNDHYSHLRNIIAKVKNDGPR